MTALRSLARACKRRATDPATSPGAARLMHEAAAELDAYVVLRAGLEALVAGAAPEAASGDPSVLVVRVDDLQALLAPPHTHATPAPRPLNDGTRGLLGPHERPRVTP
jgi:hypothetical protein